LPIFTADLSAARRISVEIIKINARPRTGTGKSHTRKLRVQGWIPAVFYGHKIKSQNIEISEREFAAVVRAKQTTHLLDLGLGGEYGSLAIIKDTQKDVLKTNVFFHIDFQHASMDEKITVKCPLEITGIPVGVKDEGGVLGHPTQIIEIECLPADIPEKVTIDVSGLHVGNSIHVRDVNVPKITIKEPEDLVLAVVTHSITESDSATATAPAAAADPKAAAAGDKKAAPAAAAADKKAPAGGDKKAGSSDKK
jgi:large subunit ribosomal protein L25